MNAVHGIMFPHQYDLEPTIPAFVPTMNKFNMEIGLLFMDKEAANLPNVFKRGLEWEDLDVTAFMIGGGTAIEAAVTTVKEVEFIAHKGALLYQEHPFFRRLVNEGLHDDTAAKELTFPIFDPREQLHIVDEEDEMMSTVVPKEVFA